MGICQCGSVLNPAMAFDPPPLTERDADADPLAQFERWFGEERDAGHDMPEAAAVATANAAGAPSVRMVLVKQFDPSGFVFFTNFDGRKGRELGENPQAALLFYWPRLQRQVRIEGPVQRVSAEETERYVRSRPRGSQISALASPQSEVVESRDALEQRVTELSARYDGVELPVPSGWGGFRIEPHVFEFWQHRADRLHDRLVYRPARDGGWRIERLAP
jgi:pyridoxamine 5'-phosphate oxidase